MGALLATVGGSPPSPTPLTKLDPYSPFHGGLLNTGLCTQVPLYELGDPKTLGSPNQCWEAQATHHTAHRGDRHRWLAPSPPQNDSHHSAPGARSRSRGRGRCQCTAGSHGLRAATGVVAHALHSAGGQGGRKEGTACWTPDKPSQRGPEGHGGVGQLQE